MQKQLQDAQAVASEGAGDTKGHLVVHTLPKSGHWVHVSINFPPLSPPSKSAYTIPFSILEPGASCIALKRPSEGHPQGPTPYPPPCHMLV